MRLFNRHKPTGLQYQLCDVLQLLDLGCGYGGTAVHITEKLKCKTVGINISPFQVIDTSN